MRIAFERLRERLIKLTTPKKKRRPTRPTKASKERRIEGKTKRSVIKKARSKVEF
jgi:ribosome-associated protein